MSEPTYGKMACCGAPLLNVPMPHYSHCKHYRLPAMSEEPIEAVVAQCQNEWPWSDPEPSWRRAVRHLAREVERLQGEGQRIVDMQDSLLEEIDSAKRERDEARADNAAQNEWLQQRLNRLLYESHAVWQSSKCAGCVEATEIRELLSDHPGAELLARIERLEERGRRQVDDLIRQGGIIERLRAVARAVEEVTVPLMPRHMYEAFRALQPGDLGGEV